MHIKHTIWAFLLGIAALLLNAELDVQALLLVWVILPLVIKLSCDNTIISNDLIIYKKTNREYGLKKLARKVMNYK